MKRAIFAMLYLVTILGGKVYCQTQLVAEQITPDNAANRLFSGSHATAGIGDWYLSNGVVEAVIDNAAFAPDLTAQKINRPIQTLISPTGGSLIDLGLVGKNNDQLDQIFQIANLTVTNAFFYLKVSANVTPQLATVTSEGFLLLDNISTISNPTLSVQTVYSLAPGDNFITVTSTVTNNNTDSVKLFNITDAILWSGAGHGPAPFAIAPGRGFNHPVLTLTANGIAAALGLYPFVAAPGNINPDDGIIDTASGALCGEVSYGIVPVSIALDPDGPNGPTAPMVTPLNMLLGVNADIASGLGNPFDPNQAPPVPPGGTFTYTRQIYLGARNDVASVADVIYKNMSNANAAAPFSVGTLTGDIDAEDSADVEATLIFEGKFPQFFGDKTLPMTQTRTDKSGKFSVTLPTGDYTVTIISPNRDDVTGVTVTVGPGNNVAQLPKLSAVGSINFTVSENGAPIPAKLTFIGINGTPNPNFSRFFDAFALDPTSGQIVSNDLPSGYKGAAGQVLNFLFNTDGAGQQIIKPGTYQVYATRGLEYTVDIKTVTVTAGQAAEVAFNLERVIDTTGYVSADFHVHSVKSPDSTAPLEDRVRSYVAEGVEVLTSTDHNFITDFAPVVQKLGLDSYVKTIVGEELTTSLPNPVFPDGFGHHIAFPLLVKPLERKHGAVEVEYVPSATFYDRIRQNNPSVREIIILAHARAGLFGTSSLTTGGIFNTVIKFNPTKAIPFNFFETSLLNTGTRNIDFDSMELYNGSQLALFQTLRNDWFSFIDQGFFKTAVAVSDSHTFVMTNPGFPRTYVAAATDDPKMLTDDMITNSMLAGNVLGTSGPFIHFDIDGKPLGSLISKKGKVTLNITVTAPAWVPVDEVRVLGNGELIMAFDANSKIAVTPAPADPTSNQGTLRFKATIKLRPKKDTYYTVEAGVKLPHAVDTNGDGVLDSGFEQPPSPPVYAAIAPGFAPVAFTNPIFVDHNNNGKFDAPGLDPKLVPTASPTNQDLKIQSNKEFKTETGETDYFPWFRMKIGAPEMEKFINSLNDQERKLFYSSKDATKN